MNVARYHKEYDYLRDSLRGEEKYFVGCDSTLDLLGKTFYCNFARYEIGNRRILSNIYCDEWSVTLYRELPTMDITLNYVYELEGSLEVFEKDMLTIKMTMPEIPIRRERF